MKKTENAPIHGFQKTEGPHARSKKKRSAYPDSTHPAPLMFLFAMLILTLLSGSVFPALFALFISLLVEMLPAIAVVLFVIFVTNR